MAFKVNREEMENSGGDFIPELMPIDAGMNQARLVSYMELGWHLPFFKGKRAIFGKDSKKAGQEKPEEFLIQLIFEFPLAEHSSEFPQTIKTSVPFGDKGEFINKLSVSRALMDGNISMAYANRSKYMKYLNAMNDSCGTNYDGLADFVGEPFLIGVTNKPGTKAREDGTLPIYSNMKPDSICSVTYKDQMDGKMKTAKVPEIIGEYCSVFSWDDPTPEAWKEVPKYLKDTMKKSVDFPDSPLAVMLAGMPEDNPDDAPDSTPDDNKGKPAVAEDDIPV